MGNEIYRVIDGTSGKYSVSNKGNVFNNESKKMLKQSFYANGYLGVNLYLNGKQNKRRVHRLVAEAFIGKPSDGMQVNHIDQYEMNGAYIRTYNSAIEADRILGGTGKGSDIIKVCKGHRESYKGYKWSYSI